MTRTPKILPGFAVVILGIVLTVIWGIEGFAEWVVRDHSVVWEGECSEISWKESGIVGLIVTCPGDYKEELTGSTIVRSYMNNPGPLSCRRYESEDVDCEARPDVEES